MPCVTKRKRFAEECEGKIVLVGKRMERMLGMEEEGKKCAETSSGRSERHLGENEPCNTERKALCQRT